MAEDGAEADAIAPEILMRQILHHKIGGYGREFFSTYLSKRKAKFLEKKKKKWASTFSVASEIDQMQVS